MRLDLDEDGRRIVLTAPTTAAPTVRQIPGIRHDSKRQLWYLPLSWASCVMARGVVGDRLEVGTALNEWARAELASRVNPSLELRTAQDVTEDIGLTLGLIESEQDKAAGESGAPRGPRRLRPDQRAGAAFLATAGSALMGDEMRLGKTPQAIRALQLLIAEGRYPWPALVVAPNSVKRPWRDEFAKWFPRARVLVPKNGTANVRRGIESVADGEYDVLVLNYEALASVSRLARYGSERLRGCVNCDPLLAQAAATWEEAPPEERARTRPGSPTRCQAEPKELNAVQWRTVIADEVHRASDPKALQTRALWAVGDDAEFRFGLTGSPPEDPAGFWAVMRFVAPVEYPAKTTFVDRYVLTRPNIFSGFPDTVGYKPETRAELDKFLLPRFIRRTRKGVFPGDPPPIEMPRYVELTGKQLTAYNAMRKGMLAEVDNGVIFATNPLIQMIRLRQFASAYCTVSAIGKVVLSEPSSKLDEFERALEELGNEQLVVFSESSQLAKLAHARVEKRGVRTSALIIGDVDEETRALNVDGFQEGRIRILFATVGAGGEGLTMNAADTVLFLQRPWSRRLNQQAQDRIVLPGLGASTTIIDLITEGTVEERVAEALADKDAQFEDLVRDADTLRRWLA